MIQKSLEVPPANAAGRRRWGRETAPLPLPGVVLVSQGKRPEAIEVWRQILDNPAPNFPRDQLLARLGQASEEAGQPEAALDYYRKLVAEFPSPRGAPHRIPGGGAELEAPEEAPHRA